MGVARRSSGTNVEVANFMRRSGGAWVIPTSLRRRSGGAWVDIVVPGSADGGVVTIANRSVSSMGPSGTRVAGFQLDTSGITMMRNGLAANGYSATGETWRGALTSADYEVRATLSAGVAPTGTLNTWMNLGTTRNWSVSSVGAGVTSNLLIEVRRTTTGFVIDTASINLYAERA